VLLVFQASKGQPLEVFREAQLEYQASETLLNKEVKLNLDLVSLKADSVQLIREELLEQQDNLKTSLTQEPTKVDLEETPRVLELPKDRPASVETLKAQDSLKGRLASEETLRVLELPKDKLDRLPLVSVLTLKEQE
jgi:hypothetical protein